MAQAGRLTGNADAQRVEIAELLAGIHPKNSTAFSANLHRWLKSHGRSGDIVYQLRDGTKLARVYGAGALFIGQPYSDYEGDTDFLGLSSCRCCAWALASSELASRGMRRP